MDFNPVPDGENVAELAITCVGVLIMTVIGVWVVITYLLRGK